MGFRADAIQMTADGFDMERTITESPIDKVILLKRDGTTKPFTELRTYTKGIIVRHNKFRGVGEVEIATHDDLSADALICSHVVLGDRIHVVLEGEFLPPDDGRWTWMISAKATNKVYVP